MVVCVVSALSLQHLLQSPIPLKTRLEKLYLDTALLDLGAFTSLNVIAKMASNHLHAASWHVLGPSRILVGIKLAKIHNAQSSGFTSLTRDRFKDVHAVSPLALTSSVWLSAPTFKFRYATSVCRRKFLFRTITPISRLRKKTR